MMNQRGYQSDQRHDVISKYINVESTLSICQDRLMIGEWRGVIHGPTFVLRFWPTYIWGLL